MEYCKVEGCHGGIVLFGSLFCPDHKEEHLKSGLLAQEFISGKDLFYDAPKMLEESEVLDKAILPVQNLIELRIDGHEDRTKVASILADNGYWVRIREKVSVIESSQYFLMIKEQR